MGCARDGLNYSHVAAIQRSVPAQHEFLERGRRSRLKCVAVSLFAGLQVFPNGTLTSAIDAGLVKSIPPDECKASSHFTIKIKCNSDGYPTLDSTTEAFESSTEPADPEDKGMWRAKTKVRDAALD